MRLTQGQVRAILDYMEKRDAHYVWTENLPIELCKHIRYNRGKWRCTRLNWKECKCNDNGCLGFDVIEKEKMR